MRSNSRKATRSRFESRASGSLRCAAIHASSGLSPACASSGDRCPLDLSLTGKRPMRVEAFFDTNVLIYAVALDDPRNARAEELLSSGGRISVQILNEFVSVARRKIMMPWRDVRVALDAFRVLCPSPLAITMEMHEGALKIAEQHGFGIYDAWWLPPRS